MRRRAANMRSGIRPGRCRRAFAISMKTIGVALACGFALSACGSGGGNGGLPSAPRPGPVSGAPLETGGEQAARAAEILFRTDSLLATRVHGQRRELPPEVAVLPDPLMPPAELERRDFLFEAACEGASCMLAAVGDAGEASSGGAPDAFSVRDLDWVTRASSAWGSRHGITLLEAEADVREAAPDTPDMRSLGAWMDHSGFVFSHALVAEDGWQTAWRYGLAGGDLAGTRPGPVRGFDLVWRGVLIGSSAHGYLPLQGDAVLTWDGGDGTVDAVFSAIFDLVNRRPHSVLLVRFDNVPVRLDGTFNAGVGGNRISGGFYGPDHRESVGVMEQLGIVGTFGARRREAE